MHNVRRKRAKALATGALAMVLLAAPLAYSARAADTSPYPINVVLSMTGQGAFVGQSQTRHAPRAAGRRE